MPSSGSQLITRSAHSKAINIADLRQLAERRLPRAVFDYIDGGAEAEITLRENVRAFEEVAFRPRNAIATHDASLRKSVLGADLAFPLILAPVGLTRLIHPAGERAVAKVAEAAGIPYCLSSFSGYHVDELREVSNGSLWYQLYLAGGREVAEASLERARKAGFAVLLVTVDTNVLGIRERDVRNGVSQLMSGSLSARLPYLPQLLRHPGWLTNYLRDRDVLLFPNVVIEGRPMRAADIPRQLMQNPVQWSDLKWILDVWRGPVLAKGISTGDDARRALDAGAVGVVVSNHGGRQLDSSRATLRTLPEIVSAINGRGTILMDGGIRRGSDIAKALCLGAHAVLCGRAYAWGLAAAGEAGVRRAVEILRADFERTLRLLGCRSSEELDRTLVEASWLR
jgi:L-lactate dehydrogenase (cytochrome)